MKTNLYQKIKISQK